MCISITYLQHKLDYEEIKLLENFIKKLTFRVYWWERGEKEPRIKWLEKQIKKL